ncbi:MAG: hypothetical protein IM594_07885 [Cytophagales bacterium]|nr:hypothetical protein [Cytophagales bacterium]MCA6389513.1 hypothetical protein [Cytophagales bacterium]MCA6391807.1 hypothetical protein [Cytophagales bacterium]MCA6398807.1 hypothetical protein [Cytophagales bacterium]MCA6402443.1 hypothetical protein [Cytophagales bacterium]
MFDRKIVGRRPTITNGLGGGRQRTFRVSLTASFSGTFYLPGVSCEAMYDHSVSAKEKGQVVEVVKRVVQ